MNGSRGTARRTERHGWLSSAIRNRFFHGKMMDVHHFEMETAYGIDMRRLLNRLVTGSGVVCGLDVVRGDEPCSVRITLGVAIDGWGREIIVPARTPSIPIPPPLVDRVCGRHEEQPYGGGKGQGGSGDKGDKKDGSSQDGSSENDEGGEKAGRPGYEPPAEDACVTVVLCYHECETDPVAVLAGDCSTSTPCAPGAIREQYRVAFEPGKAEPIELSCRFPDVLSSGEIDYAALARWVTRECPAPARNPCVPLANLRLDCREDGCAIEDIDITIRPIVFGNDILVDILTRIVEEEQSGESWRR